MTLSMMTNVEWLLLGVAAVATVASVVSWVVALAVSYRILRSLRE